MSSMHGMKTSPQKWVWQGICDNGRCDEVSSICRSSFGTSSEPVCLGYCLQPTIIEYVNTFIHRVNAIFQKQIVLLPFMMVPEMPRCQNVGNLCFCVLSLIILRIKSNIIHYEASTLTQYATMHTCDAFIFLLMSCMN